MYSVGMSLPEVSSASPNLLLIIIGRLCRILWTFPYRWQLFCAIRELGGSCCSIRVFSLLRKSTHVPFTLSRIIRPDVIL